MPEFGRTVAFVAVHDVDRVERFYGTTPDLPVRDERPFAVVAEAGGTQPDGNTLSLTQQL